MQEILQVLGSLTEQQLDILKAVNCESVTAVAFRNLFQTRFELRLCIARSSPRLGSVSGSPLRLRLRRL